MARGLIAREAKIEFRLLGPLEVLVDGGSISLGPPQQRALLALLLINANEVLSRDRIIDDLWGGEPPATAAKLVQVYVSALRKLLEPDRDRGEARRQLITRQPGYVLEVDREQLDLRRFERRLEEGRTALAAGRPAAAFRNFENALELWSGPPLADFTFAPFAQAEIGRLEELRLAVVSDRIEAELALGRADVIGELEALVAEHPVRERLRGQLMLALYRSGRQAEALDAYQGARRTLVDELGIEPSRELRELEQAILQQDPGLDRDAPDEEAPAPERGMFVGRHRELAAFTGALEEALAGSGRLILIAGEPGIGKSRLADELIRLARSHGARVLVGRCWEAGGAPAYWPWVQALRAYIRETGPDKLRGQIERDGPDLATIIPELRELFPDLPVPPAPESEGARFRVLESAASFLRTATASAPVVLILDDLHAADASSLLLLRFVAGQLAGSRLLIVSCYRDTEVGPELSETLAELSREPAVQRLALRGLGESDTSRLLELAMGGIPTDELAAQVQAETQGNPLFAAEIGRLLAAEDTREAAHGKLPIPESVREAIQRRLQRQSKLCSEVLALASVIGRDFDPDLVGRVSGLEQDDLLGALDEASAARLVDGVPEAGAHMRFSHILVRDALYEDLPGRRRLHLHRAIGEALEVLYGQDPEPHLAELAHHYLEGGVPVAEKAIEYAQRAGDRAMSQHAYEEAARHYRSALRLLERTDAGDRGRTCELLLSLGEALSRGGSGEDAKQALRRAAALAEESGRSDQLSRAALAYGGRFAWARASTDPALVPLLERALAAVGEGDSPARVRLLARLAGAMRDNASHDLRVRLGQEAVDIATRSGDPATLAVALDGNWGAVEGPEGHAAGEGIAVGLKLISLGEQIGDKERVFAGHDHRLHGFWILGDRAAVDVELDALCALADDLRQPAQRWYAGTGRTMLALMEGRFEEAEQLISETVALGQGAQSWNALVSQRVSLFVLRRAQGRLAELADTIERSVHEYPALLRFRCALAHLYGQLGRERDARACFDALLSRELAREHLDAEWLFSMALLPDPCAFLEDNGAAERLYSLLLPYEHLYAEAPVEASFGSLARGLGVLATTLGRFEDAEQHFDDAIQQERNMKARPWVAHCQHDLAATLLARGATGDRERADALRDEALATYRELGMETWAKRASALS